MKIPLTVFLGLMALTVPSETPEPPEGTVPLIVSSGALEEASGVRDTLDEVCGLLEALGEPCAPHPPPPPTIVVYVPVR